MEGTKGQTLPFPSCLLSLLQKDLTIKKKPVGKRVCQVPRAVGLLKYVSLWK